MEKNKGRTVNFTDFDLFCSEMIIFESILTTLITNLIFLRKLGQEQKSARPYNRTTQGKFSLHE